MDLVVASHGPSSNVATLACLFDLGPIEDQKLSQHVRAARAQALTLTTLVTTRLLGWKELSRQTLARQKNPKEVWKPLHCSQKGPTWKAADVEEIPQVIDWDPSLSEELRGETWDPYQPKVHLHGGKAIEEM